MNRKRIFLHEVFRYLAIVSAAAILPGDTLSYVRSSSQSQSTTAEAA